MYWQAEFFLEMSEMVKIKIKKRNLKSIFSILLCLWLLTQDFCAFTVNAAFCPTKENIYYELLVPTQLTKIGDTYYLVDSYHNQILCSKRLGPPAKGWNVMAENLKRPHSIAGDGVVFLVADTDNHRIICYVKNEKPEGYTETQIFENIGVRPHYIVYDASTGAFYAWSSMTGGMYLFRRKPDTAEVYLEKVMSVPELYGQYVRSFTIEGDRIYLPCVHGSAIIAVDKKTFRIKNTYSVPESIAGMVQLIKIQNYYYLTVSTDLQFNQNAATIVRAGSLEDFTAGNYESVNDYFGINGAPYYISEADGSYYTVVIRPSDTSCGYKFDVVEDQICNLQKTAN